MPEQPSHAAAASSAEAVVRRFIAAIEAGDLDAALTLTAADVEYDNVPMSKVHGVDAVRSGLGPFVERFDEISWPISVLISDDSDGTGTGNVFTERVDRFRSGEIWLELAVAGLFTVADGKITLWRDYFDLAGFTEQMSRLG